MSSTDLAREVSPRTRGLLLKNLSDFQTELARIQAGFVPGLAEWEQRKELPRLVFRSLRRVQDLRLRGRELGVSFAEMHLSQAVVGRELLDALCAAPSVSALFRTALIAVPRALIAEIGAYLADNATIYDLPTVPLLEADRDELLAQIGWAEAALATLASGGAAAGEGAYEARIATLAAQLTPALREQVTPPAPPVRQGRKIGVLPLADAVVPGGFRQLEFGPDPSGKNGGYPDRARYHATNFLQEVQAADSCASMLFEAPDMPWEFFFDLSRHMWDEARHAMFGEKKLADVGSSAAEAGLSTKAYSMRQTLTPLDRYAALTTQEADAFPGKHAGLKDALAHHDSVSAMAWSYDIADETQHVRFGNKWLPVLLEKSGESRSSEQVKADACNWRESVLAAVYRPAAGTFAR